MTTPGGNQNQNQNPNVNLDPLLQASIDLSRNIDNFRESLEGTVDITRNLARELKRSSEVLKTSFQFSTEVKHALDDARNLASKLGRDYIDQEKVLERINTSFNLQEVIQKRIDDLKGKVNTKNLSEKDLLDDINRRMNHRLKSERSKVTDQEIALVNYMKEKEAIEGVVGELKNLETKVSSSNNKVKEMQLRASALGRIFQSLTGIPFLKDFMDFKKISDAFNISGKAGMAAFGSEIMRVVKSPLFLLIAGVAAVLALFRALIKAALDFEKSVVAISNNLGFTRNATIGILDNFRKISQENLVLVKGLDSAFLSVKNQAAATAELQEILGTNAMFTNQMVQSQILLTKQMGLSKEEAAGIQKLSLLSGKSADDILQNAISQNKTAISYRKIISDISRINGEISVMYKNNPELIAKAVIEANKLGLSLEDTQKIAKSLLDFETSIAGELEAELLTGQRFNFEKARALALDGKSVEAAKELIDQMGGLNGLTRLNVIQRERLAASIGMSAEELTKSAREQQVLNQLGVQNRAALEEQYELMRQRNDLAGMAALKAEAEKTEQGKVLLQDIARANLQQRFQESMERIKQIFTELAAGPLIKILEGIAKLLQNTTLLKGVFYTLGLLAAGLAVKIAMATGGLSLLIGGLAALTVGGLYSSGSEDEYTATTPNIGSNRAAISPTAMTPNQNVLDIMSPNQNRADLQNRISAITPSMASRPEVPYSAPNYTTPQNAPTGQQGDVASNTQNKAVIQNNIVLEVDGIKLTTAQKKIDVSYA